MNPSLMDKLEGLRERYAEVGALLAEPEVASDPSRLRSLAREHAELGPIVECFVSYNATVDSIEDAREILAGPDPDLRALAEEEIEAAEGRRTSLENELKVLLLPADPADAGNVYLEIRAGTGGDEAALFAGDLLRMYLRYGELRGWRCDIVSESPGEHGGYREVVVRSPGAGSTRGSSSSPAATACRGCRRRSRRGGSTPRRARWRCCPRPTRSARSRSTPPI